MTLTRSGFAALVVIVLGGVSWAQAPARSSAAEEERPRGLVLVVGGIGGFDHVGQSALRALPRVGVRHEIRDYIWTHGWGQMLPDLQDTWHLTRKASELAVEVRRYKATYPDRPVYLIGKSGGAGLVLMAAEELPPGTLERIILLSAAVSPSYDLRPAFRATKGEIVSFYSPGDWLVLGLGTSQFGTVDRVYGPSAGLCRFTRPAPGSGGAEVYRRLVEVPWSLSMVPEGYAGGHIGTSMPGFVAKEVAPWLR